MNRIFKVLWNAATGTFIVTSETAKSRGKKNGRRKLAVSALIGLSSIMASADALANAGNDTGSGVTVSGTTGSGWIAIGTDATANTYTNVDGASAAMGYHASAMGKWSTAIGSYSQSTGDSSLALGVKSTSAGDRAIAMGASSSASGSYSMAMGVYANSSGAKSVALGYKSVASGATSAALGYQATASGDDSAAFGNGAKAVGTNSVALGSGSIAQEDNSVAVGNSTTQRQITYVAKGDINSTSTDAVTGAQIYSLSQSVADRLGGGASVNSDGTVNAPLYEVGTGIYNNVGSALSALNTSITNTEASVAGLAEDALLWDDSTSAFSASHTGNASKITNLAAGTLAADSTDAVNGSQLFDTNEKVDQNTADITANTDSINQNTADITANTDSINQNTTDIAANTTSINQNTTDIATNTTNINSLSDSVTTLTDDALLWDAASGAFSAKHNGSDSKITNLAAGTLAADSTDAVNGSQLFDTNEKVDQNTADITANTDSINQNTADITANTDSINQNTTDIAANTTSINQNTTDIATNTTNINSLSDSVTTLTDDALLWDAASGAFSAKHNGSDSKITNLAAGTLAADSTDAVNGSQLFATNENVSQNTTDIAANTTNINQNTADITTNTNSINQNTTDIATNTTNINNLSDSITTLTDDALLWDADSGTFSASRSGSASKITNLAAGTLAADSTDAVNGSQLYETNQKVDQNTSAIADINTSITNLSSDNLSWNETTSSFSASHGSSTTNKITNVAAGELSEESTDAVNGSQLFETNEKVDQNTTDIAANTTNITQNSTAIENLNTSVSDINTSITGLTDNALLWDEDTGAFSANHGGSTSKITNVAAGALSEDSTDAVNGSQLYETNQKVDQNTSAIADINTSITNLGTDALSWDDEEGAFSASHGTSGTNKITNVAAGEIASDSTDAINGSQLYETNMLISQYNESISQLAGDTSETYITENGTGVKYIRTNDNGLEGQDAYATGNGATAVGYDAVASGAGSLALGQNSSSSIDGSIALGSGSTSNRAITTGIRETSATSDGVVIGYNTTDRKLLGALSLGTDGESYRQITNVADGSEAQDAVTVRQLQNAIGAVTTTPTKYYHANSTEEDSLAVGTDSLAMGAKTIVNADAGIGIGLNTLVMADAINGIAIGSNARANHANSIAMGNGSQTTRGAQTDYTAYNMDTPQNSVGEFSVGSEDGQRQITNVAAGSADTDAVNVGQLKVTDAQVSRNTQSITNLNTQVSNLDTRVTNIENGIGDIVTTGSTKYFKTNTDGADANAQGADSVAIGSGSIAAAENSVALGTNSVADEANTVSVGSSTQQRRITNVAAGVNNTDAVNVAQLKASEAGSVRYETNADGSVNYSVLNLGDGSGGTTRIGNVSAAVNDTDAVNYAQLKRSVEEANTYTDQKMGEMNSKIKGVENKMSGGIASAMAMAGLPQAYAPGANMTSIAGGTFNGESAIAIGVSMVSESGGWVYKLQGTSNSQGDYSAAIGAGFQW
ncbi:trimeric autotransporter adhesin SadA [Salmonella enterica subsp. enterica serovar Uganda]|uniref:Trimeric autotransporter adhesin SadA n=17 Tax=Salmonella enterica TaxID=28901 RepID=A0A8F0BV45_SALER|nr:trimeric autotransporter adhesin SadA [Salmonella enterica]UAE57636.1 trimeric autotransporter adhesin SadA [Salmonella enterica subsp. enterica serovar Uganda var. 15+]AXD94746.1 autotransporter adhesin SadA [Salmonella enterica]ECK0708258.1 autotransporter adhesin SadA [Salmonella enterica subsp. enterica serovar Uganda]ECK0771286.1 autotransporter adhesin SadA [Salmonella enterica subsp. enterica serovar Uganda]ECK0863120.1 autotransporter adhesin SadA [Salmonella enterica subsp. enteric